MEQWRKAARSEGIIADLEALVPQEHLLRKTKKGKDSLIPDTRENKADLSHRKYTYDPVNDTCICPRGDFKAYNNRPSWKKDIPKHAQRVYKLSLQSKVRSKRYTPLTFGKSILIEWSKDEKRIVRKRFMRKYTKPLLSSGENRGSLTD